MFKYYRSNVFMKRATFCYIFFSKETHASFYIMSFSNDRYFPPAICGQTSRTDAIRNQISYYYIILSLRHAIKWTFVIFYNDDFLQQWFSIFFHWRHPYFNLSILRSWFLPATRRYMTDKCLWDGITEWIKMENISRTDAGVLSVVELGLDF